MDALVAICLRLFPESFRLEFGPGMADDIRHECRQARRRGRVAAAWCAVACLADLVGSAAAERWAPTWHGVPLSSSPSTEGLTMRERLEHWQRDLRHAMRSLRRTPGFTAVTVLTLALAIGATTAMFAVVNTVLIDPLPFGHTDRLVSVTATAPGSPLPAEFDPFYECFIHYRERSTTLEDIAFYNSFTSTFRIGDRVERIRMSQPTYTLFSTLGVAPLLGRLPAAEDDSRVIVISYALWQSWFGGDPAVVGRQVSVFGDSRTIIAVMRPEFHFPTDETLLWLPVDVRAANIVPGRSADRAVARMKAGVTTEQAAVELTRLAKELPARFGGPPNYTRIIDQFRAIVGPLTDRMLGPSARPLGVLFAAAGIVLLIACANVANLFTVRAETRRREMAVRQAIGAQRSQLLRAQLSEVFVVAGCAGALAVLFARLALPVFIRLAPPLVPRLGTAGIDVTTVVFTAVVSVLVALACGLVPALRMSAPGLLRLRDGSRGTTGRRRWGRDALVAAQTALALVLLIGSGLLLRSHAKLSHVNPGYSTRDLYTFQIAPEQRSLVDGPSYARFSMAFMDRMRALRDVESVGLIENVPLDEGTAVARFRTENMAEDAAVRLNLTFASEDYHKTMGIRVIEGRPFTREDAISTLGNVVISRSAAKLLWPDGSPLGRRLQRMRAVSANSADEPKTWETVVGVVDDVMQENFRDPPQALVYFPLTGQLPTQWSLPSPAYVVKTSRAETIAPEIRALVRELAPEAPMYRAYTMAFLADRSMRDLSFTTLTLALVSALALILGVVGLYGALSYVVAERTREIGVRMALGAQPGRVRRMVVAQGAEVVIAGIAIGLAVAYFATRALGRLLYGVAPLDLATFAWMAVSMLLAGLVASYVPARRASNVDPIRSLRAD